jgi:ubiquinone/menaquinone biosynthesis C-methylase UbiE
MGWYGERVLPHLINLACGTDEVKEQRRKVVPLATGRVLEVGMGPGLNLPFYDRERIEFVWGLEPSEGMRRKAAATIEASDLEVRWLGLPGEEIPLDDDSADSIVLTYTLCSIADWRTALDQMRRVLKPGGQVYFSEHGAAPDAAVLTWQRRLNPIWKTLAGGCHLDRPIVGCLEEAGFEIETVETEYRGKPKSSSFTYWGVASAHP